LLVIGRKILDRKYETFFSFFDKFGTRSI